MGFEKLTGVLVLEEKKHAQDVKKPANDNRDGSGDGYSSGVYSEELVPNSQEEQDERNMDKAWHSFRHRRHIPSLGAFIQLLA